MPVDWKIPERTVLETPLLEILNQIQVLMRLVSRASETLALTAAWTGPLALHRQRQAWQEECRA